MSRSLSRQIPLAFSLLSAGPAAEMDEGYALLDVNALITQGREGCVAFVVTGDSMRPDILPGYIVFIDPNREPLNGNTVAVSVNNETCIKLFEQDQRRLYLVPKNGDYPITEVKASDSFHILGVVMSHLAVY